MMFLSELLKEEEEEDEEKATKEEEEKEDKENEDEGEGKIEGRLLSFDVLVHSSLYVRWCALDLPHSR